MILIPRYSTVFVSVPKCGTKTLYEYLPDALGGTRVRSVGFHGVRVPAAYMSWRVVTCVRNPYDRAVSLWYSTCRRDASFDRYGFRARTKRNGGDPDRFADFMNMLVECRPVSSWLGPTMVEHLRPVKRLHDAMRLELLGDELRRVFPDHDEWPELPRRNATEGDRPPTEHHLNCRAIELVNEWARYDFLRFGYEMRTR